MGLQLFNPALRKEEVDRLDERRIVEHGCAMKSEGYNHAVAKSACRLEQGILSLETVTSRPWLLNVRNQLAIEGFSPPVEYRISASQGGVHCTDDRAHAGPCDRPDRKAGTVDRAQGADVGETAGAASSEGKDRRSYSPDKSPGKRGRSSFPAPGMHALEVSLVLRTFGGFFWQQIHKIDEGLVNALGDSAGLVGEVLEVVGGAAWVDVTDPVALLDRYAVAEETTDDAGDSCRHGVRRIDRDPATKVFDTEYRNYGADSLAALDLLADTLLCEKDAVSRRLERPLVGIAHDLRRRVHFEMISGVLENGADLRATDGVDHGVADFCQR